MTRGRLLLPAVFALAGLLAVFHPSILSGLKDLQLGFNDPRLINYLFEHSWLWVTDAPLHGSFWSPPIMYPAEGTGAMTDTVLGTAPLYWGLRALGITAAASLALWCMACLLLDFAAAYVFLRRVLHVGTVPACAGAWLFGFGIARVGNLNSPQLLCAFYGMFGMLALARAIGAAGTRQGPRWFGAAVLLFVLQAWSSFYVACFYLMLLVLAWLVTLPSRAWRGPVARLWREHRQPLSLCLLGGLALLAPLLWAQYGAMSSGTVRSAALVYRSLADLTSWIDPGGDHWLYGRRIDASWFAHGSSRSMHTNGVGFFTGLVALLGLTLSRRRLLVRVVCVTTVVVILLMTRWPNGVSAWFWLVERAPLLRSIRYSARIGEFLSVPAGIGLAVVLQRLIDRRRTAWAVLITALCLAEQLHVVRGQPESDYQEFIERIAGQVDPGCEAFCLQTVETRPREKRAVKVHEKTTNIAAMWVGVRVGRPTINGHVGQNPRGWKLARVDVDDAHAAGDIHGTTQELLEQNLANWLEKHGLLSEGISRISVRTDEVPWYPSP